MADLDLGRLTPWLEANVEGFSGPAELTKFPGGQSNPTYRLDAASGAYVLRRKPFGAILPSVCIIWNSSRIYGDGTTVRKRACE